MGDAPERGRSRLKRDLQTQIGDNGSSLVCFIAIPSPRTVGFARTCVTPFEEEGCPPVWK
jgi:hypothetical protein